MFQTESEYLRLVPLSSGSGDMSTIVPSYPNLVLLRPVIDKENHCQLVGDCCVHG